MSKITTTKIKNSEKTTIETSETVHQKIDRLAHFIEKNAKALALGFAALMVVCFGYFIFSLISENAAQKKFEKAFAIEKQIAEFAIAEVDPSAEIKKKKTPETDAGEFEKINTDVLEFVKSNPNSEASRNLSLKWSNYLFSVEKFDMALAALTPLNIKKSNSLGGLAELAKASTTVQLGKVEQAIGMYKQIINNPNWNYIHPEARFQMSLALIENNQQQEALENLKTIVQEHPKERKTVEEATKIMRWLTFKKNSETGKE